MVWPTVQNSGAATNSRCIKPPGAVLGIGQALLDRRPLGHRQGLEQGHLLGRIEILEHLDRVVGIELRDRRAGLLRDRADRGPPRARPRRDRSAARDRAPARARDQRGPVLALELFEEVGLVGDMKGRGEACRRAPRRPRSSGLVDRPDQLRPTARPERLGWAALMLARFVEGLESPWPTDRAVVAGRTQHRWLRLGARRSPATRLPGRMCRGDIRDASRGWRYLTAPK